MEDAHLVVAFQDGRLDVVAFLQTAVHVVCSATGEDFGSLLFADFDVAEDFFELIVRCLSTHHGSCVKRMTHFDGFHAFNYTCDELVVDAFVDEYAAWAGTHLTLVQGEHGGTFEAFVEELIVSIHHRWEEDVGRLTAELHRHRIEVFRCVLHDQTAGGGFTGEGHFVHTGRLSKRLACFRTKAVYNAYHAGRNEVANDLHQYHDGNGRLFSGLHNGAASGSESGSHLPCCHEQWEVPRNDLRHHTDGLLHVHRNGGAVEFGHAAFFSADHTTEVAEVINHQGQVGVNGFANRLAVVNRFNGCEVLQIRFNAVSNFEQDVAAVRGRGLAPGFEGFVGRVKRTFNVSRFAACNTSEGLAIDWTDRFEVFT